MSQPLSNAQRQSLEQALDLLARILKCAEDLQPGEFFNEERDKIDRELRGIRSMLADGKIDIKSSDRVGRQAETDRNGIHVNDTQDMFNMPGDLHLDDCREGYFASAWLIIAMLIHEKYHYDHHTGFLGALRAPFDFFFGGTSLMWSGLVDGQTLRTWNWKEFKSYAWAYSLLTSIGWLLEKVCRDKPTCIPCCAQNLQWLQDAAARQNPWSTYGG